MLINLFVSLNSKNNNKKNNEAKSKYSRKRQKQQSLIPTQENFNKICKRLSNNDNNLISTVGLLPPFLDKKRNKLRKRSIHN